MGRNAQPIEILKANGKKHLTKAETEGRKNSEIKFGTGKLICPSYIKSDVIACAKWKEITKIYKDVDFISSGDSGLLARYCMTHSEYISLCETRNKIIRAAADWSQYSDSFPEDFQENIERMLTLSTDLSLEAAINKKMDMLIKMEDRLFLSPLAKVKNVAKAPEKKPESKFAKFGAASG